VGTFLSKTFCPFLVDVDPNSPIFGYRGDLKSEVITKPLTNSERIHLGPSSAHRYAAQLCVGRRGKLKALNLRRPSLAFLDRFDAEKGGNPPVLCVNPLSLVKVRSLGPPQSLRPSTRVCNQPINRVRPGWRKKRPRIEGPSKRVDVHKPVRRAPEQPFYWTVLRRKKSASYCSGANYIDVQR
jgi:hypothetical protein